jgi:hypothetical protein
MCKKEHLIVSLRKITERAVVFAKLHFFRRQAANRGLQRAIVICQRD